MRLVFMGTPDFAVPSLEKLANEGHKLLGVVTRPDRPRGRGRKLAAPPVKETAQMLGLPVWQPQKVSSPEFIEHLVSLKPDLLVTVAFGQILSKQVLEIPSRGCVNLHPSLLPEYRGAAPIHRAIIDGKEETGITTMYMDVGLDTGDIILQRRTPVPPQMTAGELHDRLAVIGAELLHETLLLIKEGKAPRRPQANEEATYALRLSRQDEKIVWKDDARKVINRIRGMNPWPGVYTKYGEQDLKIRAVDPFPHIIVPEKLPGVAAGEIVGILPEKGFLVAAGDLQAVLVTGVQPEGKRTMTAAEFLRGYCLNIGERFGSDEA